MHVLDSSAFIHEYHTSDEMASVPAVEEELEGESAFRFDAMEGAGMHIHIPADNTVETIERAAVETGDGEELSVTDDYAMQNVAEHLGVVVEAIARDGITEQRDWRFQCQGCGREFDDHRDRCPICGSDLSRKNPA
jgi:UPF0271 protein